MGKRESDEHRRFEELAVAHVVGGLGADDAAVFRSHLLDCADCRARIGELRAIAHELADVERDERRQRSAEPLATAERDDDEHHVEPRRMSVGARVLGIVVLVGVMGLAAWSFTLRGSLRELEELVDQRVDAAAVLELGTNVDITILDDGVEASVKVRGDQLALLVEGLAERPYGVYLVSVGASGDEVVHYQSIQRPADGRLLVLAPLTGAESGLLLTEPESPFASAPSGRRILQANMADVTD